MSVRGRLVGIGPAYSDGGSDVAKSSAPISPAALNLHGQAAA
jgi:hypothetical protein